MKNFIPSFIRRLIKGAKKGFGEYTKTISQDDPRLILFIFGFLKNVGKGLWNGVKGAVGGFFGGGGKVVVAGTPAAPIVIAAPKTTEDVKGKPNILLYAGIAVGVVIFAIIIIMMMKRK